MLIKQLIDEDFVNYKKPSMFIAFPKCSFKCDKECDEQVCQNSALALSQNIEVDIKNIVSRYVNNYITQAIIIGGLEPFDTYDMLLEFIKGIRTHTNDDIVIYTGYYKDEIKSQIEKISLLYGNIIIKFGRFIPNSQKKFDKVLGIYLASDNQYAERIS